MAAIRSPLMAILGPTNTGKTHLAVERMCAHSSGMMGFPLRLLAREVYDRVVAIKGERMVALITGEERIEPPGARYYCCTAESMILDRDFAFVAIDEAQLGIDPERGHIFTDRMLHARGREETMILGSDSLRSLVRKLAPDAEIVTRPRFSTLSYAGSKKLSRLPKRSAIVAFSVEQVYAVAEMLRRFRGGSAVVMGALSPRTRNAQVAMFQSGEVDYLVATDAIGMGLNLDVDHVAFAGLHKFDGVRRRRLTIPEMAQIAGRAGRHQRDGSFGTLAGEGGEFTPEEVLAIENHDFARLDWLYWRNNRPRTDNIANLIDDLEQKPDQPGLRTAPEALDLDVLKRLFDFPEAAALANSPAMVARFWEVASLPDFRQLGVEPHSRFVASLWQYLGKSTGVDVGRLPDDYASSEIARLDNVTGDIPTLSARIAAVRTWTYIAHRRDWLTSPTAMAQHTMMLEQKLSDALHDALKQRFVDRRTAMLLRKVVNQAELLPVEVNMANRVLVDGEDIGALDGFAFRVDPHTKAVDRKMLLAAADRHLGSLLRKRAETLSMAEDIEFSLKADQDGKPAIYWNTDLLGHLAKGRNLVQPDFHPIKAIGALEGDTLRPIVERAEGWVQAQLVQHMGGILALQTLSQDPAVDGQVRALAIQLAEAGGIASRIYLADTLAALPKESRGAARKGGIIFGALDIYHHLALKPSAARWRVALFAARDGRAMPDMPPESAVHLKDWNFAHPAESRNAGYRRIGDEYLRIDLAERVIKKAHEARGQANIFGMDMAFVTSLGVTGDGLKALMRDAGFRAAEAPVEKPVELQADALVDSGETAVPSVEEATSNQTVIVQVSSEPAVETEVSEVPIVDAAAVQPVILSYWRWLGLPKPHPRGLHHKPEQYKPEQSDKKPRAASNTARKPVRKPDRNAPAPKPASPPSSLALQLAALQGLGLPKSS